MGRTARRRVRRRRGGNRPPGTAAPATAMAPAARAGGLARALIGPLIAVVLAIGIGVYLGLRSGRDGPVDRDAAVTTPSAETATAPAPRESARELFSQTCASCHTLAAAGATGGIGPSLDEARPSRQRVGNFIRNGSVSGVMPAGLLTGQDAERVAAYVSRNAGR